MNCKIHTSKKAAGYCQACGAFFCEECLNMTAQGKRYCTTCLNAKGLVAVKPTATPPTTEVNVHLKLVAVFKTGKIARGTAYKIDLSSNNFFMLRIGGNHHGQRQNMSFNDLKGVYHVKSFSGPLTIPSGTSAQARSFASGKRVIVRFSDGEMLEGFVHSRYRPESPRFTLVPANTDGNIISVIIERSAVQSVDMEGTMTKNFNQELTNTTLRKKLLKQYWTNPSAHVLMRHLYGMLDATRENMVDALQPYLRLNLAELGSHGPDETVIFAPPRDRVLRDFIIREHRHLSPARMRGH